MPPIQRSPRKRKNAHTLSKASHRTDATKSSKIAQNSHPSKPASKPGGPAANGASPHRAETKHEKGGRSAASVARGEKVQLVSSKLAYRGPLFDVYTDYVREPGRADSRRDVVRHSGSVVILAIDASQNAKDPLVLLERQYRHAAGRYMWEVPAGRKEPDEVPLPGAKRELLEETGYRAKRWTKMVRYYASPGFLGEWMQIYLAEGLTAGKAQPDEDEYIECIHIPLSQAVQWIESGKIVDGKSIIAILMYEHNRRAAGSA